MESEIQLKQTFEVIADQFLQAWLYFFAAKHLEQANMMGCLRYLNIAIYWACIDDSILVFSRLMLENPESVTFHSLLNLAENHPELFPFAHRKQVVKDRVAVHRKQLNEYAEILAIVRKQRNKMLAHLDSKNVSDPTAILAIPMINFQEVEKCLRDTLNIFNVYYAYFCDSTIHLGNIEENIRADVEYLSSLISDANKETDND